MTDLKEMAHRDPAGKQCQERRCVTHQAHLRHKATQSTFHGYRQTQALALPRSTPRFRSHRRLRSKQLPVPGHNCDTWSGHLSLTLSLSLSLSLLLREHGVNSRTTFCSEPRVAHGEGNSSSRYPGKHHHGTDSSLKRKGCLKHREVNREVMADDIGV